MDPTAVASYAKRGGDKLIGRRLSDCHNPESRDIIQQNHLIDIIKTWIQKEPGR